MGVARIRGRNSTARSNIPGSSIHYRDLVRAHVTGTADARKLWKCRSFTYLVLSDNNAHIASRVRPYQRCVVGSESVCLSY